MRHAARVAIGGSGLEITLTETGRAFRWPLTRVRQTQGAYAGEQVRLEHGGEIAEVLLVADPAFLTALRAAAPDVARAFRAPARRRIVAAVGVLATVATLGVAVALYVWGIPGLADVVAARVPVSWEVALGEAAMAELAPPASRCHDPERERRIDEITAVLLRTVPQARYPFRVTVIDEPMVNAFATPGGFIVVFRGLLEHTDSPEELAGVLAHEIQHIIHRDATRALLRQASTSVLLTALVGDVGGVLAFGVQTARTLGDFRYSREAERAADRDGLAMLQAAGVDPAGMLAFFRTMQRLHGSQSDLARYLSTHPTPDDRLEALSAAAAAGPRARVKLLNGYDWRDIKQICAGRSE